MFPLFIVHYSLLIIIIYIGYFLLLEVGFFFCVSRHSILFYVSPKSRVFFVIFIFLYKCHAYTTFEAWGVGILLGWKLTDYFVSLSVCQSVHLSHYLVSSGRAVEGLLHTAVIGRLPIIFGLGSSAAA